MAKFKIKDVEKVMMAYIYEVEAETPEEALDKYINELAGSLPLINDYICDDDEENVTILNE